MGKRQSLESLKINNLCWVHYSDLPATGFVMFDSLTVSLICYFLRFEFLRMVSTPMNHIEVVARLVAANIPFFAFKDQPLQAVFYFLVEMFRVNMPQPRLGLEIFSGIPTVARASQPWALGRNPVRVQEQQPRFGSVFEIRCPNNKKSPLLRALLISL